MKFLVCSFDNTQAVACALQEGDLIGDVNQVRYFLCVLAWNLWLIVHEITRVSCFADDPEATVRERRGQDVSVNCYASLRTRSRNSVFSRVVNTVVLYIEVCCFMFFSSSVTGSI